MSGGSRAGSMNRPGPADIAERGAPGGTRTPSLQVRSLLLCPVELRTPRRGILSQGGRGPGLVCQDL
jgi:hypothetical protein